MAEVSLRQISKSYDGHRLAVRNLDLVCRQGEMLALLGPSGCGKSSTLKMVAGIEPVTSGEILFDGIDVTHRDSAGRNVAMVFEDYSLYPHLSAFENIAFPLRVRSVCAAEVSRKVHEVVNLLNLQSLMGVPVRSLSGGAQQRVSIGRALVRDPALVMFDEPLSHLDADQKAVLRTEIRRLQLTAGLTSVLVTHDQTEAMAMADRIAVMNDGELQQVGLPQELYEHPANRFVAGFIGESPMNFLDATVDSGTGAVFLNDAAAVHAPIWVVSEPGCPGISQLVLGIRPEDIRIRASQGEDALTLMARIIDRESCGDRMIFLAAVGSCRINIEMPTPAPLRVGDHVCCYLPVDRLHAFEVESGRSRALRSLPC